MIVGGAKATDKDWKGKAWATATTGELQPHPQPLSGTERGVGRCGAAIDVSGSPLLCRRGAGGEDIYTIVGCWMRPVSRRVNAQDSFSDVL
jgi:hypothetical protein